MYLAFDLQTYQDLAELGESKGDKTLHGPDSVIAELTFQFVKPGKGKMFVRGKLGVEFATQVRPQVVADWLQGVVAKVSRLMILNGEDYASDTNSLARLIRDTTSDLPPANPSDPRKDDDAGGG